ncbi:hypothetical protein CHELA20_53760 [Hyphomicrobiales bacterium]|nr:hypothetical protein CHELA41_21166 [Hyphomicrobiales bacterium]CAH1684894.1 hypothetical protein CHELA20_53760 [Hyphomicrobiales bacterium]
MLVPGLAPGIFYGVRVDLWPATPAARGLHVRQPMIKVVTVRPPHFFRPSDGRRPRRFLSSRKERAWI